MNYKKLNEIKAGKAVYKHDGTLEQLQEVEVYCEGTDSPTMKGASSHYHVGEELGFCAISSPILPSGTTVYGSKDIFTEHHYFDEGAPVWVWNDEPGLRIEAHYEGTNENSEWPYLVFTKKEWPISCQNIAPRVEDTPECSAGVPKQSNDTPVQSDDKPEQLDDTQVQPETKVKSVKTYTITLTEYEDGWIDLNRVCEGFSYFEVIGVLKKVSELVDMDFNGFKVK